MGTLHTFDTSSDIAGIRPVEPESLYAESILSMPTSLANTYRHIAAQRNRWRNQSPRLDNRLPFFGASGVAVEAYRSCGFSGAPSAVRNFLCKIPRLPQGGRGRDYPSYGWRLVSGNLSSMNGGSSPNTCWLSQRN